MDDKIDFVMIWVDGNDTNWQNEKSHYQPNASSDNGVARYRDWDNLKYWFRGVEKYAPWVNKIHFVTWGHLPSWLDVNNPKLNIVNHKDYIPSKYLPTFSANPIELNLHRISNLSDKFVYFNDDIFIIDKIEKNDFFLNNKVKDICILQKNNETDKTFKGILNNDMELIKQNYSIGKNFISNLPKYINIKYGKQNIRTITALFSNNKVFYNLHGANAYFKSTFNKAWSLYYNELDNTCTHKFRDSSDVNQYVIKYLQFLDNLVIPSKKIQKAYNLSYDLDKAIVDMENKKYKLVCLNDGNNIKDFEYSKNKINQELQNLFPNKSSFEK